MKIGETLKRSWAIVWRYKILWLFGFFAAEAGGGGFSSNFNSGNSFNSNSMGGAGQQASEFGSQAMQWFSQWWPVLVGGFVFLILVGIVFWILSIAARGGIVALADDAAAGRDVRGSRGWSVGFHYWGRVFLQGLVFGLPVFVITLVFVLIVLLIAGGSIAAIVTGARGGGSTGLAAGGIVGLIAGVCGLAAVFFFVVLAIGLVYAVLVPVSLRFAILHDRPAVKAIGDGWHLVRSKLGKVALTAVTLWGLGIAFGIGMFVVILLFIVPVALAAVFKLWFVIALVALVLLAVLIVAGSIWSAFYSTTWTIAFRAITEPETAEAPGVPGTPVAPPYMPPSASPAPAAGPAVTADAAEPAPPGPAAPPAPAPAPPAAPPEPADAPTAPLPSARPAPPAQPDPPAPPAS
jgi:hypothetical protein